MFYYALFSTSNCLVHKGAPAMLLENEEKYTHLYIIFLHFVSLETNEHNMI